MHVVLVDDYAGPGTAGWLKSGSSWIYLDPTGANGGITRMAIADRSAAGPGRVKVTVTGREGELLQPVGVADLPLDAAVALGRTGWSVRQGSCGESKFELGECKPNASGTSITCKKQLG
jgi:hypothetical protein